MVNFKKPYGMMVLNPFRNVGSQPKKKIMTGEILESPSCLPSHRTAHLQLRQQGASLVPPAACHQWVATNLAVNPIGENKHAENYKWAVMH